MNQRDIARLAGVSTATVSRVVNSDPCVSTAKAELVKRVIKEHGYITNAIASNLRSAKTKTIGFIVVDLYNDFFSRVFCGIDRICQLNGYNVLLQNTDDNVVKEKDAIHTLCKYRVAGIIASFVQDGSSAMETLKSLEIPVVLVDRKSRNEKIDCVVVDNEGGIKKQVDYLVGLGHKRIAIICGSQTNSTGYERLQGYIKAMKENGLEVDSEYIQYGEFYEEGGYKSTIKLLGMEKPPTAIISSNNLMSIGAFKAIKDIGLQIPRDVSLTCFDDFQLASHLNPPLTVIQRPMQRMGEIAAELLFGLMMGSRKPSDHQLIVMPTELNIRESCSSPDKPE